MGFNYEIKLLYSKLVNLDFQALELHLQVNKNMDGYSCEEINGRFEKMIKDKLNQNKNSTAK